jgi:hypothetical protein
MSAYPYLLGVIALFNLTRCFHKLSRSYEAVHVAVYIYYPVNRVNSTRELALQIDNRMRSNKMQNCTHRLIIVSLMIELLKKLEEGGSRMWRCYDGEVDGST